MMSTNVQMKPNIGHNPGELQRENYIRILRTNVGAQANLRCLNFAAESDSNNVLFTKDYVLLRT